MEADHLIHQIHHSMQSMCEASLVLFGAMLFFLIVYLILGKI